MRQSLYNSLVNKERHYSFGMAMTGHNYSAGYEYRYGFNGQEKDDEITDVTGATNTAMFWEYDTRLGRRWNMDPKPVVGISDYATFGNNPIFNLDVLGDRIINAHEKARNKAEDKKAKAAEKLNNMQEGERGYKKAKRELRKATNAFNEVDAKYLFNVKPKCTGLV